MTNLVYLSREICFPQDFYSPQLSKRAEAALCDIVTDYIVDHPDIIPAFNLMHSRLIPNEQTIKQLGIKGLSQEPLKRLEQARKKGYDIYSQLVYYGNDNTQALEEILKIDGDSVVNRLMDLSEKERFYAAKERIHRSNIGLVTVRAVRFVKQYGGNYGDYFQEGLIGLEKSILKVNLRGLRFSTYAVYWIDESMRRFDGDTRGPLRIPRYLQALLPLVNRQFHHCIERGIDPSATNITSMINRYRKENKKKAITDHEVENALVANLQTNSASIEELSENGFDIDSGLNFPDEITGDHEAQRLFWGLFNKLSSQESQILRLRYGLFGTKPHKLTDIASMTNVSREWVRLAIIKTIGKIQNELEKKGAI